MAIPVSANTTTLFDSYNRQARLFPGLLTMFPALLVVLAWFPWLLVSSIMATLLTLVTSCGLLYALVSWTRTKGRQLEPMLRKEWGGWPTTLLLRHTSELDIHTRQRCHTFLSGALPELTFPTAEQELANPRAADAVYDSAVMWLKERTRGKEFSMLHQENAQYGFRRNLLGLKPVAITLCVLTLLVSLTGFAYTNLNFTDLVKDCNWTGVLKTLGGGGPAVLAAVAINVLAIVVWISVVTKNWVKEASFQYATAILATCDKMTLQQATK